jgi:sec-independent protein translocase protein TatC
MTEPGAKPLPPAAAATGADDGAAPEPEAKASFFDHLNELRIRLVRAAAGIAIGTAAVGWFADDIFRFVMKPVLVSLPEGQRHLNYTSYLEPFLVYLKVALYGGTFVSAPWMLYQIWLFVAPGLYKREKTVVTPFLVVGTLLFYSGVAFTYYLVMPYAFPALASIAGPDMNPLLTMKEQLSLVLAMMLGFGVVFEIPVIIAFLAMVGLVTPEFLARYRRHAWIVCVILAAIITPTGDPFNLAIMAVPMVLFYEIGILAARIVGRKKAPETAEAA